ncbi:hypothetical protein PENSPDRAFT_692773 [Peniophora sp. CONT]|nr:hypothetical protein PENSPDRAFT_692773 [Peniophora sp. CONT]
MSRSIHARHAESWHVQSPWAAEWIFNSFKYCTTPEGKDEFQKWIVDQYSEKAGNEKLKKCKEPPPPRKLSEMNNEERTFQRAASDLSTLTSVQCQPEELRLYHEFSQLTKTAMPPRLKAAPARRRGETSEAWLSRRNEGIAKGGRSPELDWQLCRAIAISELDRVRDESVALRADVELFTRKLFARQESIIASPETLRSIQAVTAPLFMFHSIEGHNVLQLAHSAWSQAASLFEDLAEKGLTTPRSLERAYKKDDKLFWRLLRAFTAVMELDRQMFGHACQIVSHSEYYRPWFKRYRDGRAHIEIDKTAVRTRPPADSLDHAVLKCFNMEPDSWPIVEFFGELRLATKRDARVGQRFSAAAYEILGDYSTVQEFVPNMYDSPFGETFKAYSNSMLSKCSNTEIVSHLAFMQLGPTSPSSPGPLYKYGKASSVSHDQIIRWIEARVGDNLYYGPEFGDGTYTALNFWVADMSLFDPLMLRLDTELWELARRLDRPDQKGTVARLYGLLDPNDPNRLTFKKKRETKLLKQSPKPQTTPAPAASVYESSIPVAMPGARDDAAVSGHKYDAEAETEGTAPKGKKKKKKSMAPKKSESPVASTVADVTASLETTKIAQENAPTEIEKPQTVNLDEVPDTLPTKFEVPRKMAKIIHRLLDGRYDDDFSKKDADAPAKGEVRWQDFEKVMRRIGFQVVQTAGSSVRFDPPAKTARPISFHRPHPDAIIPHIMAKWYGARLSRVYGWTMSTFEAKAGAEKDDAE